jgi:hypothetical protein
MNDLILVTCHIRDLEGPGLDWAVALVEGVKVALAPPAYGNGWRIRYDQVHTQAKYSPSTDWAQGGPLIEKHVIDLASPDEAGTYLGAWTANCPWTSAVGKGFDSSKPLVAACRSLVAAKLGGLVQVPQVLLS